MFSKAAQKIVPERTRRLTQGIQSERINISIRISITILCVRSFLNTVVENGMNLFSVSESNDCFDECSFLSMKVQKYKSLFCPHGGRKRLVSFSLQIICSCALVCSVECYIYCYRLVEE